MTERQRLRMTIRHAKEKMDREEEKGREAAWWYVGSLVYGPPQPEQLAKAREHYAAHEAYKEMHAHAEIQYGALPDVELEPTSKEVSK